MQLSGRQWLFLIVGVIGFPVLLVGFFMTGGTLWGIIEVWARSLGRGS